ncbi:xylulokinase [Butyrivibrio sp. AE2032]|uniref:xylulokinase n=1 Tax=Butyrivibrio sp. AE2032 TaxID=1458463 RepID=UPI000550E6EA|nr:FGGY-family carbohydrate kinase [Butyrivibrio sp. AE2032]
MYYLTFDVGTSGVKGCLISIESTSDAQSIRILDTAMQSYGLFHGKDGIAEQDIEEIYNAIALTSRSIMKDSDIGPKEISAIAFCGCLIGSVAVDCQGKPVCKAFSFMDYRGIAVLEQMRKKPFRYDGLTISQITTGISQALAIPMSGKDLIWRIKWLEQYNPEAAKKVYKWLNYKEYFIYRATGKFVMSTDTAWSTFLYDTRDGHKGWNKRLLKLYDIDPDLFPQIVKTTDIVGLLTQAAADELGLCEGIPVVAGANDTNIVPIGAGTVKKGDINLYLGTCGWVSTVTAKRKADLTVYMATMVGAQDDSYNMYGQVETAGSALSWIEGLVLEKGAIGSFFDNLTKDVPPGSNGVLFAPWLEGVRAPFADDNIGAMFINMNLGTDKAILARSVMEGIAFQLRWLFDSQMKSLRTSPGTIRVCGGAANSEVMCGILADVFGTTIEKSEWPQNCGAIGLSCLSAIAVGQLKGFSEIGKLIRCSKRYAPDMDRHEKYEKLYRVYRQLYRQNKRIFKQLVKVENGK